MIGLPLVPVVGPGLDLLVAKQFGPLIRCYWHTKFAASSVLPVPLYTAAFG